jgi:hypothetical protein
MTGYLHPQYAASFAEFGQPRELPRCGGWILERPVPDSAYRDAMGCYPLFACRDWSKLDADLDDVGGDLVSLSLVADPYGAYELADLQRCFDVVVPFKEHFVADFNRSVEEYVSRRHRKRAAAALEKLEVQPHPNPLEFLDDWVALYDTLIARHGLTGVKALSPSGFAKQLTVPGIVVLTAVCEGTTVGAHLYYTQEDRAYCHLAAFSPAGYDLLASFALQWRGIQYFSDKTRYLGLGAGAGLESTATDGLTQFKRGWASRTRTAYFCGRIFDRARYTNLVEAKKFPPTNFFPAYRVSS